MLWRHRCEHVVYRPPLQRTVVCLPSLTTLSYLVPSALLAHKVPGYTTRLQFELHGGFILTCHTRGDNVRRIPPAVQGVGGSSAAHPM